MRIAIAVLLVPFLLVPALACEDDMEKEIEKLWAEAAALEAEALALERGATEGASDAAQLERAKRAVLEARLRRDRARIAAAERAAETARQRVLELEARLADLQQRLTDREAALAALTAGEAVIETTPAVHAETRRWLRDLGSDNESLAFAATIELARLKDHAAVPALVEQLRKHPDFYVRLGAATALGEMLAADAVHALVEAIGEREELVRIAANEALQKITGADQGPGNELGGEQREALQTRWKAWIERNENRLRERQRRR